MGSGMGAVTPGSTRSFSSTQPLSLTAQMPAAHSARPASLSGNYASALGHAMDCAAAHTPSMHMLPPPPPPPPARSRADSVDENAAHINAHMAGSSNSLQLTATDHVTASTVRLCTRSAEHASIVTQLDEISLQVRSTLPTPWHDHACGLAQAGLLRSHPGGRATRTEINQHFLAAVNHYVATKAELAGVLDSMSTGAKRAVLLAGAQPQLAPEPAVSSTALAALKPQVCLLLRPELCLLLMCVRIG